MLVTGLGVTEEDRLADLRMYQTRHCEKTKEYLMNYSQCRQTNPLYPLTDVWTVDRSCCCIHAEAPQREWM
jgi:hypothetical protein